MAVRKRKPTRRVAVRRKSVPAKRTTRRRRRGMANPFAKATMKSAGKLVVKGAIGGALAEVVDANLKDTVAGVLPAGVAQYASAITIGAAAYATKVYGKQPDVAAGMAGVAGAKLAASLMGTSTGSPVMQGNMLSQGINYAMSGAFPLSGYQVPMSDDDVYASGYANQFS